MSEVGYNPDVYWEQRGGESYLASIRIDDYGQHLVEQLRFFRDIVTDYKPEELLDFGCGTGKLFSLWKDVAYVSAYDRSHSMIREAMKERELVWSDDTKVSFWCGYGQDRKTIPYADGQFDLVVACEVLAHIMPDDIEAIVGELARVLKVKSKKGRLAIVTAAPFKNGAAHNFDYDYEALLKKDFTIEQDELLSPYRHILAVRKDA